MTRSKHVPNPTVAQLVAFREFYKLTPAQAAALAMSTETQWRFWEDGLRRMHPAIWAWVQHAVTLEPRGVE